MKPGKMIAGLSLLLLPVAGLCQTGAMTSGQILERVSETYQHFQNYHIVAARRVSLVAPALAPTAASAVTTFDLAVEKPARVRLDYKQGQDVMIVSDGSVTWRYIPQKKEYTKSEVASSIENDAGIGAEGRERDPLTEANDELVARYTGLARYSSECALQHEKSLKFDGRKTPCYVLRIFLPASAQTLWIDKDNFQVLRHDESDAFRRGAVAETMSVSVRVREETVNGPLDASLFDFTPPAGAREVASLDLPGEGANLVGRRAADFNLKDFVGERMSLSDYRGKVVLIDFWATWCPPCRKELPTIAKLDAAYRDQGLVVLGINSEGERTVKHYFSKHGFSFPTLNDPDGHVAREYGANAIPNVLVIDAGGVVRAHFVGVSSEGDLMAALQSAGFQPSFHPSL